MKKIFTLILLSTGIITDASSQCNSTGTYDLVVFNQTTFSPSPTSQYISAFVCGGATLIDSMSCCTRLVHVQPGATFVAGPQAYGAIYLKSGATFNGQNTSMSWTVFAEAGATIINYSGMVNSCNAVTFSSANCFMSAPGIQQPAAVTVFKEPHQLIFNFPVIAADIRVELYDMNGRLVINEAGGNTNQHITNIDALPAGMYFCRVLSEGAQLYAEKVVIVK
ncbi:MAG: T9SS type A sorting domain-containing protein [Bacteroidota bacterium]|nr:T9SS type A sorting domain-containing protein [Bacteroidota bacterium]